MELKKKKKKRKKEKRKRKKENPLMAIVIHRWDPRLKSTTFILEKFL